MKAPAVCSCCGQKIRPLNPHKMCAQKVRMLEILGKAHGAWVFVEEGNKAILHGVEQRAPYRARAHASRLVWFGLAEHGDARSGNYRVTPAGLDFLLGHATVPKTIWCKDGKVVEQDTARITITGVRDVVLDRAYWDRYALEQATPREKQPALF